MKKKKLKINYINFPRLTLIICKIFGHRWNSSTYTSGGEEICERCTKYKNKDEYWGYGFVCPECKETLKEISGYELNPSTIHYVYGNFLVCEKHKWAWSKSDFKIH